MQIKSVELKPYDNSISPALSITIEVALTKFREGILSVQGRLESDDGKILSNLIEVEQKTPNPIEIGARGSSWDSKFQETTCTLTLVAPLEKKAVDYIEDRRLTDRKRDVHLKLDLNVKSVVNKAEISHMHRVEPPTPRYPSIKFQSASGRKIDGAPILYGYDSKFTSSYTNLWVLSGNGSPVFLALGFENLKHELRIAATDWIHDFAPRLELGEFFIVEIPKGKKYIKKAWSYVEKAEECFRQWDTKGAFANCREAGTVLNEQIRKKLKNEPSLKKWKRAFEKFEKLTSLDLHIEDIKKETPRGEISIGRADTEHMLIVAKALIKYTEELLQEKK